MTTYLPIAGGACLLSSLTLKLSSLISSGLPGDYDSWYLRDAESGEYLRGFEHWEQVDGALVYYLITGPLHWLGILHLGASEEDGEVLALRYSSWAPRLLNGQAPEIKSKAD